MDGRRMLMIVAGGKNWDERISGYGREGDGDDSRRDLNERKIDFVDGGERKFKWRLAGRRSED